MSKFQTNIISFLKYIITTLKIRVKTYQNMRAEGIASLRKRGILQKASMEKPVHVFLQAGKNLMYSANNKKFVQYENPSAKAGPFLPKLDLKIRIQHKIR